MRAALELLRDFDAPGRRIVVCGDMAELGERGRRCCTGNWATRSSRVCGADLLIACGEYAGHVVAGGPGGRHAPRATPIPCRTPEEALPYLGPGDPARRRGAGQRLAGDGHGAGRRGAGTVIRDDGVRKQLSAAERTAD